MFKQWIYTPTTGSKVFVRSTCNEIVFVTYNNGSHDVFHQGAVLTWEAAQPGSHFRNPLHTLLENLIPAIGGVAWDERGTLGCIVPRHHCSVVLEHVEALVGALGFHTEHTPNRVKMVVAGQAAYVNPAGKLEIDPLWVDPLEDRALTHTQIDNPDYVLPPGADGEEAEEFIAKPTHIHEVTSGEQVLRTSPSLWVRDIEGGYAGS